MAGKAKPCATCGHLKSRHGRDGSSVCSIPDCVCTTFVEAPPEPVTESFDLATKHTDVRSSSDAVAVIERHRSAVNGHETLDDARKIYCVSILDAILVELNG